jgi:hypothetical protein
VETFERLQEVKRCLDQLVRHDPALRLVQVRDGLRRALHVVRRDYTQLRQAADWLEQIAEILDPDGKPPRSGAEVQAEWQQALDQIEAESQAAPALQAWAEKILQVSSSYAPGLFYTYDVPGLPRTNKDRESEFRDLTRRLLSTTGQVGAAKRLVLREGAWKLIPGPGSLPETIEAISQVNYNEFLQERVITHRRRFRPHTRSVKQSDRQLKQLCDGRRSRQPLARSEFCAIAPVLAPGTRWSGEIALTVLAEEYILAVSIVRLTGFSVTEHSYNAQGE